MNRQKLLLILCLAGLLSGCSTIVHGTSQDVVINTSPQGATAAVAGTSCTTPCKLNIPKATETLVLTKQGYGPRIVPLRKRTHVGTLIFGNILNLSFGLGALVDISNGAKWYIVPVDETLSAEK